MNHIIEVELRFRKKINPNFWVRVFSFLKFPKVKIGFIFNYRAFLTAWGASEMDITEMDSMPNNEKISLIVYGAALEYCREHKRKIFFEHKDITEALLRASQKTNNAIGEAMTYARMPDWLDQIIENLPKDKQEGVKKK